MIIEAKNFKVMAEAGIIFKIIKFAKFNISAN